MSKIINMVDEISLSENIVTKLCHDLAGPIGAVNNGIELLELDPNDDKAMELLHQNALTLLAYIRYYRLMLGKVDEVGEMDLEKLRVIWSDFFKDTKLNFKLRLAEGSLDYVTLTGGAAKIISLALLTAQQIGITGGNVDLILTKSAEGKGAKIEIHAQRIILNDSIKNFMIHNKPEEANTHNILLFLLYKLTSAISAKIDFSHGDQSAIINIVFGSVNG